MGVALSLQGVRAGHAGFVLEIEGLVLHRGEAVALHGPSGAGKSTLLDLLALARAPEAAAHFMLAPREGPPLDLAALWAGGRDRAITDARARHYGYVLQQGGLLPFLDVRDVTARALAARGVKRPLLLATRYTMEEDFFLARLRAASLSSTTPDKADRDLTQAIIFDELCLGRVEAASKRALLGVIARGLAAGADSVILGCTELMLLIGQGDVAAPVFDTTALHVEACLDHALSSVSTREVA